MRRLRIRWWQVLFVLAIMAVLARYLPLNFAW